VLGGGLVLLDGGVEFLAVDPHVRRGGDADAHLIAVDLGDLDLDAAVQDEGFPRLSGEDQHAPSPSRSSGCRIGRSPSSTNWAAWRSSGFTTMGLRGLTVDFRNGSRRVAMSQHI